MNEDLIISPKQEKTDMTSVENLGDFKVLVTSKLDVDDINKKKREVMGIFRNLKVPGNRPGKATDQMIMSHYRDQFKNTLVKALAEEAYHNAVSERKLRPLGPPQFKTLDLSPLESQFTCTFEVLGQPEFDLPDFKTWEIVRPAKEEHDVIVEKQLQLAREQATLLTPFVDGDVVQAGDSIVANLDIFADAKKIESMCGEGQVFELDRELDDKNFGVYLVGMKPGETKVFDMPGSGFFEGKTLTAKVELLNASKRNLPELNDDLAVKFGCTDLADLRGKISSAIDANEQKMETQKLLVALKQKIKEHFDFKVPEFLIEGEAKMLATKVGDWDKLEDYIKDGLRSQATDNLRFSFFVNKVAEDHPDCQLADMEALSILENVIKSQANGNEAVAKGKLEELRATNNLPIVITRLKEEFIVEKLLTKLTIVE